MALIKKLNNLVAGGTVQSDWLVPISDNDSSADMKKCTVTQLSTFFNSASPVRIIGVSIDGGGSVPSTGIKGYVIVPFAGTITGWRIVGDLTGSAVVDVFKIAYGATLPTSSIAASAKPTLSSSKVNKDDTITGWTTVITADDIIGFNLDSVSTITKLTVELKVQT